MSVLTEQLPLGINQKLQDIWDRFSQRQLTRVFATAREVLFDDRSRLVFFSDCHRGDRGVADGFARNAELFFDVLQHYYQEGFSYVEVGDGDELWKNRRFHVVREAYGTIFDLLHQFHDQGRLHMLLGNHDIGGFRQHRIKKDGILAREGLVLKHAHTGRRIFAVHGHQADFTNYRLYFLGRMIVRRIWRRLQMLGLYRDHYAGSCEGIERRLRAWAGAQKQPLICGHTHHPVSPKRGEAPYFNTGSCLKPGEITGLELMGGAIQPIRWTVTHRTPHIQRTPVGPAWTLPRVVV